MCELLRAKMGQENDEIGLAVRTEEYVLTAAVDSCREEDQPAACSR